MNTFFLNLKELFGEDQQQIQVESMSMRRRQPDRIDRQINTYYKAPKEEGFEGYAYLYVMCVRPEKKNYRNNIVQLRLSLTSIPAIIILPYENYALWSTNLHSQRDDEKENINFICNYSKFQILNSKNIYKKIQSQIFYLIQIIKKSTQISQVESLCLLELFMLFFYFLLSETS
ncbi:hypothetical protein pb186bvf_019211 [Paramecium bursaria]